jgi:hypothetical protein
MRFSGLERSGSFFRDTAQASLDGALLLAGIRFVVVFDHFLPMLRARLSYTHIALTRFPRNWRRHLTWAYELRESHSLD